jgi:hypothetical protein
MILPGGIQRPREDSTAGRNGDDRRALYDGLVYGNAVYGNAV